MPCILNAANEVAVAAFLNEEIRFLEIPDIIENCMATTSFVADPGYDDYVETDKETRIKAKELIV